MTHFQIPFAETPIELRSESTKRNILRHSPSGKVPALVTGDFTICDSLAIAEYLAERFPERGLWPHDFTDRADARAISAEMHSGFPALREALPMDCLGRHSNTENSEDIAKDIRRIQEIWDARLSEHRDAGPFLYGDFSIADAFYAPVVSRFKSYDVPRQAVIETYMDAIWELPAIQEWLAGCKPGA
jgi:glutathione S-transferase